MYVQDVVLPSVSNRKHKRTGRTQEYSSRSSVKSSHPNDRQGWNDTATMQDKVGSGVI